MHIRTKRKYAMKRYDDDIIRNLDGQEVANAQTGEFYMEFNKEQKKQLMFCFNHRLSVDAIAYPGIPAPVMEQVIDVIYRNSCLAERLRDNYEPNFANVPQGEIWKITHTNLTPAQTHYALCALTKGVNFADEIEDLSSYNAVFLQLLWFSLMCGRNYCKALKNKDTSRSSLANEMEDFVNTTFESYRNGKKTRHGILGRFYHFGAKHFEDEICSDIDGYIPTYVEDEIDEQDDEYAGDEDVAPKSNASFFTGCSTIAEVNKRYKSLIKIYHPDNGSGDEDTIKEINIQYGEMKKKVS